MNRRLFAVFLCLVVAAILTGCSSGPETSTSLPPVAGTVAQIPAETPAPEVPASPGAITTPPPGPETTSAPAAATTTPTPLTTLAPLKEASPLTVLSIVGGEVLVKRAGTDTWQTADAGTTLEPGDTIKTGGASKAEITFFEGSTIELVATTELLVSDIGVSDAGSTTISLRQQLGRTVSRVKKLTDTDSRYDIETPAAVAAVRGSTMAVTVLESGKTEVANLGGDIRVIVDGEEYIIHEGMKRTIIPGQKPGPEVPIYQGGEGGGVPAPQPQPQAMLDVTMLAEPPLARVGDNITYSWLLSNTGGLPFNDIEVINDVSGAATYQSGDLDGDAVLDPGENWLFISIYTLREGDPSPLVATATISATTTTFIAVVETETASISRLPDPGIGLVKTASATQAHAGDNVTYAYTVTNTGDTPLLDVTVFDDLLGNIPFIDGDDNVDGLLDLDETWAFSANYTVGVEDPDLLQNTAVASGTDSASQTVTASASAGVAVLRPGISLVKTPGADQVHVGDNVTYTYTVGNTGNTPLLDVSVGDDLLGNIPFINGDDNGDSRLDLDETWAFSANYTVGVEDPDWLQNMAVASGADNLSLAVTSSDSAGVAVLRPGISLVKTASASQAHVGDIVTYTYTVNNAGNTPLLDVSVADDLLGIIPFIDGDDNGDNRLDLEETWAFSANYTVGVEDPDWLQNMAVASGTDNLSLTVTASASAGVTILRPGISLVKTPSSTQARVFETVTYTYTVSNTGNTPLLDIHVEDDRLGPVPFIDGDADGDGELDAGETWTYRATYRIMSGDISPLVNTAVASGRDALYQNVAASDMASVEIKCT